VISIYFGIGIWQFLTNSIKFCFDMENLLQ
jgi:hypothetical protein